MSEGNPFDRAAASRPAMRPWVVLGLLLAACALPASAHGPPDPRAQDVRLLADHNDDCGGHGPTDPDRCRGTHDLVGLDLTEAHDATHGDVVRLRLVVNGGEGARRVAITLTADGTPRTLEVATSDNQAFTGNGFLRVTAGPALNADGTRDGARILVEGTVRLADLGGAGALLDDVKVQAYAGSTRGDYMPGGYYNTLDQPVANPPQGDAATNFERTSGYVLRGPSYYAGLHAGDVQVPAGASVDVEVHVTNGLRGKAQTATLRAAAPAGLTATWDGQPEAVLDLPAGGAATARLRVQAGAAATGGDLELVVTTNLGGRTALAVPVAVASNDPTAPADPDGQGSADSPAPTALLTGLLVAALAAARRRA